jgi:hypothetical protein
MTKRAARTKTKRRKPATTRLSLQVDVHDRQMERLEHRIGRMDVTWRPYRLAAERGAWDLQQFRERLRVLTQTVANLVRDGERRRKVR